MPYYPPRVAAGGAVPVAVKLLLGPASLGVPQATSTAAPTSTTLDAAADKVAYIFSVPKDGTLNRVGFRAVLVGTQPQYRVSFQTLNASGEPSGSVYGGCAATDVTVSAGWNWATLSTGATAAAGDRIAAVIEAGAVAPDASNHITVQRSQAGFLSVMGLPYTAENTTAAWVKNDDGAVIAARYSDGVVVGTPLDATTILNGNVNSGTSPDEVGCAFTVPVTLACVGARVALDPASGASVIVRLYSDTTEVAVTTAILAVELSNLSVSIMDVAWDAVALSPGTTYRLTVVPQNANNVDLLQWTVPDADSKAAWPEGSRWQRTARTDAGAFAETATQLPLLGIWVNSLN